MKSQYLYLFSLCIKFNLNLNLCLLHGLVRNQLHGAHTKSEIVPPLSVLKISTYFSIQLDRGLVFSKSDFSGSSLSQFTMLPILHGLCRLTGQAWSQSSQAITSAK
jgi:hypothetical protein